MTIFDKMQSNLVCVGKVINKVGNSGKKWGLFVY